ncbi:MAG: hypothetical protein NUV48_14840 [Peptococcaceae bacterium]|nr:hypothetical protein [Peptococcaceae bacterium]
MKIKSPRRGAGLLIILEFTKKYQQIKGGDVMTHRNDTVEVEFPKLGHFWLDNGLIGFLKLIEDQTKGQEQFELSCEKNAIRIKGSVNNIQTLIENTYETLINNFYNLSTKKQKEDTMSYNFYYDSKTDKFISFPKRKSVGIAELIFNKAARPTGSSIKWKAKVKRDVQINGKTVKRNRAILPKEFSHLQKRMDEFLDKNGLDVTTAGLLVDGPNAVRPNVTIKVASNTVKGQCYLCGQEAACLEEANQTVFPLITGSSGVLSFNSQGGKPERVCWKCSLMGKFVPVTGFYMYQDDSIYAFLPYSSSLEKMKDTFELLQDARTEDPSLLRNFKHPLGGYFQHPFEATFAFLYTLYDKVLCRKPGSQSEEDDNEYIHELDFMKYYDLVYNKAPVEFIVIHSKNEGNTFSCKMMWPFKETVYFFKLLNELESRTKDKLNTSLSMLVDYSQKKNENKTLLRNRVLERILKKQTILDLVEEHVFHSDINYFKPLLDMLLVYEYLIKEEDDVFKEEQDAAVSLGRRIGVAVGKSDNGKKGDLFALRKTRRMVDFLEQLNRLQFKLGSDFIVPADVYEGKLTEKNFTEFKQFCMVAALNSYNAARNEGKTKTSSGSSQQ